MEREKGGMVLDPTEDFLTYKKPLAALGEGPANIFRPFKLLCKSNILEKQPSTFF
jgi:hypothetical protein